jgi:hypothetical protein
LQELVEEIERYYNSSNMHPISSIGLELKDSPMSDHPEVPRVEFNEDGESMNVKEATARFLRILSELEEHACNGEQVYNLRIVVRACDCDYSLTGHDPECVLHGDKS